VGLWLNESGHAETDRIHVEHNGLLLAHDAPAGLLARLLGGLVRQGHRVVLGGVDEAHAAAARQGPGLRHDRAHPARAHVIDLAAVRAAPGGHLALLSANARQQIRRSLRRYGEAGAPRVVRAATLEEARAELDALSRLHQDTWTRRGLPGAFANPAFVAFHAELLEAAWPRGEIDLLRVEAGGQVIGHLYNFVWRGRVANYQSGFDYPAAASAQHKPGLTCHHLAVEMYAAEGQGIYDLLAGDDRYKTSLATGEEKLHWFELLPRASLAGVAHLLRQALGRG
jgi:CelD/BcsL family acetyltransferase involved in cellulose biosynthesis